MRRSAGVVWVAIAMAVMVLAPPTVLAQNADAIARKLGRVVS